MSIDSLLYDANGHDEAIELGQVPLSELGKQQLLWVDVGRDEVELDSVAKSLELGEQLRQLPDLAVRPRISRGDSAVQIRATGLRPDASAIVPVPVDFYAKPGFVVSIHDGEVDGLDAPIRQTTGETRLGELDAGTFLALLLDELLGGYFEAVERIEARIDRLDVVALRDTDPDDVLETMISLRRDIARLRRALAPQRTVFSTLTRPDAALDADLLGTAWPGLAERFQLAVDAVENARELLVGSFEILMTRTGQRTNDVMRVLTVISAVLLPSVVLAGVMGMNFHLEFFDTATNFYVVLIAMAGLAGLILAVARWRRWL